MISEKQYVTKGIYRRAQIGGIVSVKNYIFVRTGARKGLLLRFFNELGHTVNGMAYTVVQYGEDGAEVGRTRVCHRDLYFPSGEAFSPGAPVAVDEKCADFSVIFSEVVSGRYRYGVIGDTVAVYYAAENGGLFASEEDGAPVQDEDVGAYSVEKKRFGDVFRARLAVILAALLLIALNAGYLIFSYVYEKPDEKKDEPYSESGEATADMNWDDGERYVEI